MADKVTCVTFDNNSLLSSLYGEHDKHLDLIEKHLKVSTASRGNIVSISGHPRDVEKAERILLSLYGKLEKGGELKTSDVEAEIRMLETPQELKSGKSNELFDEEIAIKTVKRTVTAYSNHQKKYIKELYDKDMVFATGPAGTGKTYLAVAVAVSMFISHKIERIILCRPAVEAGEKIGFLPGDMKEKVDPYMQPLYDALYDMLPAEKVEKYIENRVIEIAPLAFMRGRTLRNAFVILDEAQNATPTQMKMFVTRLGEESRMAINGDLTQIDLPAHMQSGLDDAINKLRNINEIGYIKFDEKDVVRHSLVTKIVKAYSDKQ